MQQPFLKGHTISLRIPVADYVFVRDWNNWYNDQDLTRYNSHGIFPVSQEQEWEIIKKEMQKTDSLLLAIYENETDRLIGNISMQEIDLVNRNTRLAITIGESAPSTAFIEAFGLMTNHAFMKLNLNRVYDATHAKLSNLVTMLGVFGYKVEGVGPEHFLKDDKWHDRIYFGITQSVFNKKLESRDGHLLFRTKNELLGAVRSELKKELGSNLVPKRKY